MKTKIAILLILGVLTGCSTAYAVYALYSQPITPEFYEVYLEKLHVATQAKAKYEEARTELCKAEADLAHAKVKDYFNQVRSLKAGESLEELTGKVKTGCPKEAFKGNFQIPADKGLDAFLQVNGAEFVKKAGDKFRAAGELYGIKPEVLVCISQADSSLGNYLKSANNIGNVGNNDRGSTVDYHTLEAGIGAMGRVLTNQYLGNYTTIGELSRGGGNKHGKIYASSEYNWNKNVLGCLRTIHQDETINESFKFRT